MPKSEIQKRILHLEIIQLTGSISFDRCSSAFAFGKCGQKFDTDENGWEMTLLVFSFMVKNDTTSFKNIHTHVSFDEFHIHRSFGRFHISTQHKEPKRKNNKGTECIALDCHVCNFFSFLSEVEKKLEMKRFKTQNENRRKKKYEIVKRKEREMASDRSQL